MHVLRIGDGGKAIGAERRAGALRRCRRTKQCPHYLGVWGRALRQGMVMCVTVLAKSERRPRSRVHQRTAQRRAESENDWRPYNSIKSPLGQAQGGIKHKTNVHTNVLAFSPT